jgi:hypothetical protein
MSGRIGMLKDGRLTADEIDQAFQGKSLKDIINSTEVIGKLKSTTPEARARASQIVVDAVNNDLYQNLASIMGADNPNFKDPTRMTTMERQEILRNKESLTKRLSTSIGPVKRAADLYMKELEALQRMDMAATKAEMNAAIASRNKAIRERMERQRILEENLANLHNPGGTADAPGGAGDAAVGLSSGQGI